MTDQHILAFTSGLRLDLPWLTCFASHAFLALEAVFKSHPHTEHAWVDLREENQATACLFGCPCLVLVILFVPLMSVNFD